MTGMEIPVTIENRWDIFYRDFPAIYDRFGRMPKEPTAVEIIHQRFPLGGRTVLDVGAGTGLSTFKLARYADYVVGIEPEASMRNIAIRAAEEQHIGNVRFLAGRAQDIPLEDSSVDIVVAITSGGLHNEESIAGFVRESERVVRKGGAVLTADLAPRWYGGELAPIILNKPREEMEDDVRDSILPQYGYDCIDYFASQDYGTVENAIQTYGFIFGRNAIDYIRKHKKTIIKWKIRIYHGRVS